MLFQCSCLWSIMMLSGVARSTTPLIFLPHFLTFNTQRTCEKHFHRLSMYGARTLDAQSYPTCRDGNGRGRVQPLPTSNNTNYNDDNVRLMGRTLLHETCLTICQKYFVNKFFVCENFVSQTKSFIVDSEYF